MAPSLDKRGKEWVSSAVGRGTRVVRWRRMTGGITSTVHDVTIDQSGSRSHVVLRRYLDGGSPRKAVLSEVAALEHIIDSEVPGPELIASDADGEHAGCPAVLMTKLPGAIWLDPPDRGAWADRMARQLAHIHALAPLGDPFELREDATHLAPPVWSRRPGAWAEAIETHRRGIPVGATRFIHGDYQHFNVLWSRGKLSGVIDWVWGWNGPPELDVGHCRLNLAVLYSVELAERFLQSYEREAGYRCDARWDAVAMLSYLGDPWSDFIPVQVAGRIPVDTVGMNERVEELLVAAIARF